MSLTSPKIPGIAARYSVAALALGSLMIWLAVQTDPPVLPLLLLGVPVGLIGAIGLIGGVCLAAANQADGVLLPFGIGGASALFLGGGMIWVAGFTDPPMLPLLLVGAIAAIMGSCFVLVSIVFALGAGIGLVCNSLRGGTREIDW